MRVVYQKGLYRIIEVIDESYDLDQLKGDIYCPETNDDVPLKRLVKAELAFEQKVIAEGVYGYELQKWNPAIGEGWTHRDSCWGFVGEYSEDNRHYIVDEMKELIEADKI